MPIAETTRTPNQTSAGAAPKATHAVLLTTAQILRGAARVAFVLVVARELGPRDFGVYALILALVEMLAVASGSGHGDYLTREAARDAQLGWGLGGQLIWLRLASLIPLVALGLALLWALGYPQRVVAAAAWLALTLPPRAVTDAVQGVLRGIGRCVAYLIVESTFDGGLALGAAWLIERGGGMRVAIAVEIISATAAGTIALGCWLAFRTRERHYLNRQQLFNRSIIFNIYAFVGNLYDRLDVLLLSRLAGNYATGIYSAAYRPLGLLQLVPYGVLYSLLPALSRNARGVEERQRLERAMGLLLSAAFLVVLITTMFAGPALTLLLGARYAESVVAVKILIWAVILRYVNYALNVYLLAGGHERVFVTTALVCLGVNLIGNVLLIPIYSWRAAAALTLGTEAVLLIQNFYWLRRTMGAIPVPFGWLRTSLTFVALLAAWFIGLRVVPPPVMGTLSILLFIAYVYRSGMLGDFAAAWRTNGSVA